MIGGDNLPSPVRKGLTDLPNFGGASGPPGPPGSGITGKGLDFDTSTTHTDGRSLGNSGEEKQRSQNVYLCNVRVFLHPFLLTKGYH